MPVHLTRRGGVATVTIDRQEHRNALDLAAWRELSNALTDIDAAADVAVVVLTGAGEHFCAGADTAEDPRSAFRDDEAYLSFVSGVVRQVWECTVPVIARVDGWVAGGGLSLMLAADMAVASDRARFVAGFTRLGLVPDLGATHTLPLAVGYRRAAQLALLDHRLDALTALAIGLVNVVVTPDDLDETVGRWTDTMAERRPEVIEETRALLRRAISAAPAFATALEAEAKAQVRLMPPRT